jgi:Na+-transporting NADH:ubiquinone oxidoreductase subunit NqrB
MSTEQVAIPAPTEAIPAAPARPAEAARAPAPRRGFQLDPRYFAPAFITGVLLVAHFSIGALESWTLTALAIAASVLTEVVLGKLFYGKVPHLASAYITGISVGILTRSPYWWPFVMASVISTASKYVLRVKDRHIWNPSNFGLSALFFLAPGAAVSLSIQFGNSIGPMLVIWTLGFFIISRLKRFHICATYVVSFLALGLVRSLISGQSYWTEIAPITGPMYQLYTFFMITDPKTTVSGKKAQMLVVFIIAVVEAVLRLMGEVHAPYYALFIVGPIANLIEIWWQGRKARPAPVAAMPAPAPAG